MENNYTIPRTVEERVKKENEETVRIYELKNKNYHTLSGMLPIVNKIVTYFQTDEFLSEDTVKALLKNVTEVAKYLEHCVFRSEFFEENYYRLFCKLEENISVTWQNDVKDSILTMQENMVLALREAEKQRHTCCCCRQQNFFFHLQNIMTICRNIMVQLHGNMKRKIVKKRSVRSVEVLTENA